MATSSRGDDFGEEELVHAGAKGLDPAQVGSGGADRGREVADDDVDLAGYREGSLFVVGHKDLVAAVFTRYLAQVVVLFVGEWVVD